MDEMKIVSGFTTTLVSKLLRFALRKKLGYDIHIQLNTLEATIKDGKTHVHIDADAEGRACKSSKVCWNLRDGPQGLFSFQFPLQTFYFLERSTCYEIVQVIKQSLFQGGY